jgi:arginase
MDIQLITVPYDFGERDRGTGAGPDRILSSGLESRLRAAGHRPRVDRISLPDTARVPEAFSLFRTNRILAERVRTAVNAGAFPVVLAGNCMTAAGTCGGLGNTVDGLVWLDAHGDFNTPDTTTSGYLDGMALAVVTGRCWRQLSASIPGFRPLPEDRVVLLGVRDLDHPEAESLSGSSITVLGPEQVRGGLGDKLSALNGTGRGLYLHIDMDVLDPSEGRASVYAAHGGLGTAELLDALDSIAGRFRIRAVAVTAYDPSYDPDARVSAVAADCVTAVVSSVSAGGRGAP